MELQQLLREYFENSKLMQLATVNDGQPWVCNVFFVTDEDNNIYWTSAKVRRHSKDIISNSITAATIVRSENKKQALQITGKSYEVTLEDAERVNKLYGNKFGQKQSRLEEVLANTPDGRAYYVLRPKTIFFWDEVNFPDAPKQQFEL
jgi:uncharacterized protein YhbP (UPF0306 family)